MKHQVDQFVKKYYDLINNDPLLVHELYDKEAEISWPALGEASAEIKTEKGVERFFAKQRLCKFRVLNSSSQLSQTGVFLVVRGRVGGDDLEEANSSFVQSFYLVESSGKLLVKNDVLSVIPDQKEKERALAGNSIVTIDYSNDKEKEIAVASNANVAIDCEKKPRRNTGRGIIADSSKAGKGIQTDSSSKANAEPTRKSSFGRTLKSTHRLDNKVYELQLKNKYPVAIEEQKDKPTFAIEKAKGTSIIALEEAKLKSNVLVIYDERMLMHVQLPVPNNEKCPETPERLTHIVDQFQADGLYDRCDIQTGELANAEQLEMVHEKDYVQFVLNLPEMSEDDMRKFVNTSMYFTDDEGTRTASLVAAGSVIKACDLVAQNKYKKAFAVVRPPGHHAMVGQADGYCLLNNAALGVAHLRKIYLLPKVLVVDIDVHHGNGTQSIFFRTSGVLFISIHSTKLDYPEGPEGGTDFVGVDDGEGFNINIPLSGDYGDGDILHVLDEIILPIANAFSPDIIIISAGYDAAKDDTMADCEITPKGYATFTSRLGQVGTGRMVMVLEGGYNVKVTAECASHSVRALLGDDDVLCKQRGNKILPKTKRTIREVKSAMTKYWDVFKDSRRC